ncbi:UDP-galactopyranose mutase [Sphingorhabdus sp.]|uniref:UDP-galactopyranose mutase n=1 Tax=Sphingorhabdus sp. TaxID=1902408 RepID=UPI003919EC99
MTVATPYLPEGMSEQQQEIALRALLDTLKLASRSNLIRWYYTPMMLPFSRHLGAAATVYDCMDELSAFRFAPPALLEREAELIDSADLVFTGGKSLYAAKRDRHHAVHCFPSSVDIDHFKTARTHNQDPADQAGIGFPRLGYYGVIDERIDLELISQVADARPDWNIVMIGPVVKISEDELPRQPNLHWLGGKSYDELPQYMAGWDVALMPFAINESTRFISPTKTPEYLAGGKVVVSTPVTDVEAGYGHCPRVCIAASAEGFVAACDTALIYAKTGEGTMVADAMIAASSWDKTQSEMAALIDDVSAPDRRVHPISAPSAWPAPAKKHYDWVVVGAGFAGAVMAERLAAGSGYNVLVVDRRQHIAGNAFDERNEVGQLYHKYGPHIFHTNSADVFEYLSRFTKWRKYEHRVLASVDGILVPIPINRTTINTLYGLELETDAEAEAWLAARSEPVKTVETSEDVVVSAIGRELYEKFFRGYTRKQWGLDPSELDKSVTARVPTRTNVDDRYFTDKYQAIPADGYTKMFENILDHPKIDVMTGVDFAEIRDSYSYDRLVYTGPVDEYFGFCYGALPYRSLRFDHAVIEQENYQPVATVNYPDENTPYTRITEYKHFTGDTGAVTSITTEYPAAEGDPYYPIPREENQRLYKRYEALAQVEVNTLFVGRLATYKYYNMDQVVGQALATWRKRVVADQEAVDAIQVAQAAG